MATRTRFSLGLLLSAVLIGGTFLFTTAKAQRSDSISRSTSQQTATGQTATSLSDGRMLLLGGEGPSGLTGAASIVDPRTGQSISLPTSLTIPRANHTATVLPDGSVLVIGGRTKDGMAATPELFDPATQTFSTVAMTGGSFRSGHTATLLSDGRVVVAGGSTSDGKPLPSEVWDLSARTAAPMSGSIDRQSHTATLLGDGRVLIEGGKAADGRSVQTSLIIDSSTMTVVESREPRPTTENFVVAASSPATEAPDVPLDTRIALRFSDAVRAGTITEQTVVLSGPDGVVRTNVVVAEHGRLAFVWPLDPLVEEETYTLSIKGAVSDRGMSIVPATVTFRTVARKPGADAVDAETWRPGSGKDGWRSARDRSPWETLAPLQAPDGVTAVSGRVLRLDGRPLADVTLEMEGHEARTDRTGRFLLRVEGIATGEHTLEIDARTANKPGRTYGFYEARIIVRAGRTNVLPFTSWSPLIDTAHQVMIASPTLRETLVTTPLIPGLELHLPTGTVIRDEEGHVARNISITPVPLDRTPFPLPEHATFSMFFTIQPGGAYLHTPGPIKGGWLVYPRIGQSLPGKRVQFFDYDPEDKGWYSYGMGTVTATQVIPDAKTRLYAFNGASFNDGTTPPPPGPPPGDCCGNGGDPVNLTTGIFTYEMTDLVVNDVMPLSLTRTYRSQDTDPTSPRAFGIGMTMGYSIFLHSEVNMQEADLILPDGGRVHYVKTPESGANWWQTIFEHTTSPTGFYKSRISFWGDFGGIGGWELKQKDGTVYVFGHQAPLQAIRDRNGNEIRLTWSGVSSYGSGKDNILRVTSPNGRWIAFTYYAGTGLVQTATDNIGRTVNYTYNAQGQLWKVTDPSNHVTEYTYDSSYRMTKIKNRNGVEYVTNEYTTAADAPTPSGWVKKQTHADGGVYEFTYNVVNGKSTQTEVKDPRGHRSRMTFNSSGYTLIHTRALGTTDEQETSSDRPGSDNFVTTFHDSLNRLTRYVRDASGNITSITRCLVGQSPCTASSPNALTTTYTYDPTFNQVKSITDPLTHTTTLVYDVRGNVIAQVDPLNHPTTRTYKQTGQLTSITDALEHTIIFSYIGGDLASITDPLGRVVRISTNAVGEVIGVTGPDGAAIRYEYNAAGQLTRMTDALGAVTELTYYPEGELESVVDARANRTRYTYDAMGRLATRVDPLEKTDLFETDVNGTPLRRIDRRGLDAIRTYDALNRLTQMTFGDGSTKSYSYDPGGRLTELVDSASGTLTWGFDDFDRVTSESTPQGSVSYTYDMAGRRSSMTLSGQPTVTYTYDAANRLTEITRGGDTVSVGYDDANRRTGLTLPNGILMSLAYDDANQLTSISYDRDNTPLGNLTYLYDVNGRRTQIGGSFARTLLPQTVQLAVYDQSNRLVQWGSQLLSYNANGGLASDGLSSFSWDARDELVGVEGVAQAQFQYDGIGRRASSIISGQTTQFVYDGDNVIQERVAGVPSVNLFRSLMLDEVWTTADASGTHSFVADHLGSTVAYADTAGILQAQYTYEPFGRTSPESSTNRFQYTGRENEADIGLYFYRTRFYSPQYQRFVSEDTIEFEGGTNLYAYVQNSPQNLVDPLGTCACSVIVRCRPVDDSRTKSVNAQHCYIVTKDADGTVMTTSAGEREDRPQGILRLWNAQGDSIRPNKPSDSEFFRREGTELCGNVECVRSTADRITAMTLPYHFLGPNSNSAVVEIMGSCGLPVTLPPQAVGADVRLGPFRLPR